MAKRIVRYTVVSAFMLLMGAVHAHAQLYPERRMIRQGNKDYHNNDFVESETDYRRALEKALGSYEAEFNLGNSLYRQGRFDEAAQVFSKLGADSLRPEHSAESYFNDGNALFQQRKLQEALEAYKNSLRRNPNDIEAKYNLAYVKKLLEDDEDNKDDQNNQDKNQDQNQDNQNQDNQNNKDNQDNQDRNDQDQDGGDNDKDRNQPPPPKKDQQQQDQDQRQSGMSREEAEQMLDAVQMNEDKTREKMDEKKAAAVGAASGKNW